MFRKTSFNDNKIEEVANIERSTLIAYKSEQTEETKNMPIFLNYGVQHKKIENRPMFF